MKGSGKEPKKRSLMDTKDFRWTREDWRGIITIATLIGLTICSVMKFHEGIVAFTSLAMYQIKDYFDAKREAEK